MSVRIFSVVAALVSGLLLFSGAAGADTAVVAREDVQLVSSEPPVGALGNCSLGGLLCGHVYNDDNNQNLTITTDWGRYSDSATWRTLRVGQSSDEIGVKDADGFRINSGCRGTVAFVQDLGPGWYKVYDGQHIHLTDIVC
jgi:hypothetical protein